MFKLSQDSDGETKIKMKVENPSVKPILVCQLNQNKNEQFE